MVFVKRLHSDYLNLRHISRPFYYSNKACKIVTAKRKEKMKNMLMTKNDTPSIFKAMAIMYVA
jgi:hypothetical protein